MSGEAAKRRFREIVPPHLDDAYRLAKWLAGNGVDAQDIVQEAALRALAALESTTPLHPRAWWLAIVRNAALTWLAHRRPSVELDETLVEPGLDPEAALIARDEGERLARALASLPAALRETLALREIEELNYREIAAATRAPLGTVMSRLARARAALAKILKGSA
ncbi:MAG: sigma-70 family RNA polymerase sigma factor [Pseudomonadota bacterium]|nr:sigma-70 family RNA polymerase sigma factor [Pseudomonadota bacterium]